MTVFSFVRKKVSKVKSKSLKEKEKKKKQKSEMYGMDASDLDASKVVSLSQWLASSPLQVNSAKISDSSPKETDMEQSQDNINLHEPSSIDHLNSNKTDNALLPQQSSVTSKSRTNSNLKSHDPQTQLCV
jgi:hypothetical protein